MNGPKCQFCGTTTGQFSLTSPHGFGESCIECDKIPDLSRGQALRDEDCVVCGFPFDKHQGILRVNLKTVCGVKCARELAGEGVN